jgi:DNA-binding Lrp family transcriptional regulator
MIRGNEPEPGWVAPPWLVEEVLAHHAQRKAWGAKRRRLRREVAALERVVQEQRACQPNSHSLCNLQKRLLDARGSYREHLAPESRQSVLAIPESLRYPEFTPGLFLEVPVGVLTKRFSLRCGGARRATGPRRLLAYLYVLAEGRVEIFTTIEKLAEALHHDPDTVSEWIQRLVDLKKVKREYLIGNKKMLRFSYQQVNGKLTALPRYEASGKRRVQGVVLALPHNYRASTVTEQLARRFEGAVRHETVRRVSE